MAQLPSFQKIFEVHSYEAFYNGQLKPSKLIDYLNDTGENHSEGIGYSMENIFRRGFSWIVLSWNVAIERWPQLRDKIIIETWISKVKRCFAYREFLIKNRRNEFIIKASSRWIFYNLIKNRSERIPQELINLWPISQQEACSDSIIDTALLEQPADMSLENSFSVQKQDIDILDHVHNTRYVGWSMENKPEFIKKDYILKHMQVNYHHEVKFPGNIVIKQKIFILADKKEPLIHDQIIDNQKNQISTEITTRWKLLSA